MSPQPTSHVSPGGFVLGAVQQLVNELFGRVRLPVSALPAVPVGDVLETRGDSERAGADAVERLVGSLSGRRGRLDPQQARSLRPLLRTVTVHSAPGQPTVLAVRATARGTDWGARGRESAVVAVYVGGSYHSSILVHPDRPAAYEVNLGQLPAGAHAVELRAATDVAFTRARVHAASVVSRTGEQALVARHAPILELRDGDAGDGVSLSRSDAPLVLAPSITRHRDGSRTIEYRVLFSNEDGGTHTSKLFARYGRGTDSDAVYRVSLDAADRVVGSSYQAALHRWLPFDGRLEEGRPVLRVSTANNMVSARTSSQPRAERWSEAPVAATGPDVSDFELMQRAPWTWTVMAKELVREGKAVAADAVRTATQVLDPRCYVYLGALDDAQRATLLLRGGLEVVLADGRRVLARLAAGFDRRGSHQTAVELPPGVVGDVVRGVRLLGVRALVLDRSYASRELARAA